MRFFIVDDSSSIRAMLSNIIEDEELGTVEGEAEDGSEVYADVLEAKNIDILLIDLLMPNRDGIETIREIGPSFKGKIIMISQVESKEIIGESYSLGVEYYITKPINSIEVTSVIKKVSEHMLLEKSLHDIHKTLNVLPNFQQKSTKTPNSLSIVPSGKNILMELGIVGESGYKDLLDLISILYDYEKKGIRETPALKELFEESVYKRLGRNISPAEVKKETKAGEQRVRRAIMQSLEHIASLGLLDYSNPKFEHYSATFFDYTQVRMKMMELEGKTEICTIPPRSNIKKFLQALYMESRMNIR
ncbi:response regulator [Mesobacillus subterraneus]|uniref:Response regulator n=1 Tax=Mesobacillus subterraneus TaxID=285983 RepID=A0A427TJK4_9BACI|nr:response regulator [Mesobacillus subterraneus]RSD24031.1 response regulator [Mesobacillus subterraneus]